MTAAIFAPSVAAHLKKFRTWLETTRPDRPFTVAADSREEAIAFLACLLRHEDVRGRDHDRAVVFESASTLRTLAQSSSPFLPIVYREETEREIVTFYRQRHCIVVRPRNAVDRKADVVVELLGHAAFEQALKDMGVTARERVARLGSESGRSPTVLRRRLSQIEAIRTPPWAGDKDVAQRLIPMALVGAWHNGSRADREVLEALAERDYDEVEKSVADLLRQDDCPVWCVDQYRGVVSKIDALFAISPWMTAKDITDFVDLAEYVLSEDDPALSLPEGQRWAAGIFGKVREHSNALRAGVCETLVMLSVHGNALVRSHLGVDVAAYVAALVERLLTPFTSDKLRSHDHDLPGYAEAAPGEFLALLEEDLNRQQPFLKELLKPVGAGVFEHPWRTGILWALERLAWNPRTLMRVVTILAQLSQTKIDDNWVNKPIGSLSAVFRSWMPQTAAPLEDRIKALETLCRRFPDIGWRICIQQFEGRQQIAFPSDRPRWRNDAGGAGHGVPNSERLEFVRRALDLAVSWPKYDRTTLGDLVERLDAIPDQDRSAIWDRIDFWSRTETDEKARAALREQIRRTVLTRRGLLRGLEADQRDRAREACEELVSRDLVRRHAWLFAAAWVEYSADDLDEEDLDFEQREKRLHESRMEAMTDIWSAHGLDGALELLADCDGWTVGRYVARCAVEQGAAADVLRTCLETEAESPEKLDNFMQGFIELSDESMRSRVIATLVKTATVDQVVRLFKCAPFRAQTWRLLDRQDGHVRDRYWRAVFPAIARFAESETTELIDRLLEVGRPAEAFSAVEFDWAKVETARLKRLLSEIVKVKPGPDRQFKIEAWHLSAALDSLDGRPGVTVDEMAQLEFTCIDALLSLRLTRHRGHGIPNLERKIAESPHLFVYALALLYKRKDDGEDPSQWRVDDPARRIPLQSAAHRLLQEAARIPGTDPEGKVDVHALNQWVTETRCLCREHGRATIGDQQIGQLLSKAPPDEDGTWPCRPICEVLEATNSANVAKGFKTGVYNVRGVVSRSLEEGGAQERELSVKYCTWAKRLAFEYPYVASILERIAEGYDRDAKREDSEVLAMKRLEH